MRVINMGKGSSDITTQLIDLITTAINELREEGLEPDIMLVGPDFQKHLTEDLSRLVNLRIYVIEELGADAVIADSKYMGQLKKASKRISIEPLLEEEEWEEIIKQLPEISEE
ncbi:family 4B encapsulin nanocompartment shell protein [Pyrococcus kukulkanii]|uniref:Family 4B encapsulin nanocompartment shell protein n=2 Tax=Pyrococcus kukulkanii TaxID=1609559 RepID=A0ABV4T556_9EURY